MTTLRLTLERGPVPSGGASRRLDGGALTIGRGAETGWTLPDPTRRISGQHCLVEQRSDGWWVTDTSRNGLLVDGQALGQGRSLRLTDGMQLGLGDYALRVRIEAPATADLLAGASPPVADWLAEPFPAAPMRHDRQAGVDDASPFDDDWADKVRQRPPAHPALLSPTSPATPDDHAPPEQEALTLRPQRVPAPARAAEPIVSGAGSRLTGEGPFFVPSTAPASEPAVEKQARAADGAGTDVERALAILLAGAGLSGDAVQGRDAEAALRDAGAMLRTLAGGLVQLLRTRALLKRELAVDLTLIGATDNNPLKLAVADDEAVLALLRPKGVGYLEPMVAAEQAFADLKAHELALLDGLRAALRGLFRRLDPSELERQLAEGSTLSALLAGGRKAQYWEEFKRRYAELARAAEARFIDELGPEFARAYERRGKESR